MRASSWKRTKENSSIETGLFIDEDLRDIDGASGFIVDMRIRGEVEA